ncbi:MAG: hypothetical protein Q8R96_09785 [Bacteroidota bacterium]|nr:hypothetical protein [Bacteroidota bacterium]
METTVLTQTDLYLDIFDSIDFEKIIDHPNILIAAHFWDKERYQAAKNCYKFMRAIDDLIDDYKTEHVTIAPENQAQFEYQVYKWINTIINSTQNNPAQAELIETVERFCIPFWPLEAFAKSIFTTMDFLRCKVLSTMRAALQWLRLPSLYICAD